MARAMASEQIRVSDSLGKWDKYKTVEKQDYEEDTKYERKGDRPWKGSGKQSEGEKAEAEGKTVDTEHIVTSGKAVKEERNLSDSSEDEKESYSDSSESKEVEIGKRGGKEDTAAPLTQYDYLQLLRCMKIKLPEGVLTQAVVELAMVESSIQDAKEILQKLESFDLCFKPIPRLPCGEVKRYLHLKKKKQILQITKLIFFEKEKGKREKKEKDSKNTTRKHWEKNKVQSSCFRLRDKYMDDIAISTPELYSARLTRSWMRMKVGKDSPILTKGSKASRPKEYTDESKIPEDKTHWKKGELEMLKFFHDLEIVPNVSYSRGNKVEYGFLSGNVDFLAEIKTAQCKATKGTAARSRERLVIECKGTTGNMVGKVFTTVPNSHRAKIVQDHQYVFQVQAYMYIVNNVSKEGNDLVYPQMDKAVMVVRQYHEGGDPPRDFHWNYIQIDATVQEDIEELRMLCQNEVLARYLALLGLIFRKKRE